MRKLEVNDVLYNDDDHPTSRVTIDRVTEKRAYSGSYEFERCPDSLYEKSYKLRTKCNMSTWWELEAPEIKELFEKAKAVRVAEMQRQTLALSVRNSDFRSLDIDQLTRISNIIKEVK